MESVSYAEDVAEAGVAESKQVHHERLPNRTALILYGSETGNAQDVAEEIGRTTERLRFDTTILDLDSVQLRDLVKPTVVIFAISTTGQGEMPQNARGFWKKLLSSALKPGILRKLRFSSFGLGDSSYAQYNVSHRLVCGRLSQLGAQSFCERGEGNEQHPEGHNAGFREWILLLEQKLRDVFPLPENVEAIAEDVFIEPKWKLVRDTAGPGLHSSDQCKDQLTHSAKEAVPSSALLPIRDAYTATIDSNNRITAEDHFQDVRLLDLRVQEHLPYGPGAVAVVHPKNFPEDVQAFVELMRWHDIADVPLSLITNQDLAAKQLTTPSPLRHLDLTKVKLTLRWLLENVLDIMSIPRRSFFARLVYFAGDSTEDEAYQKERLLELANPELIDELWDYTTRPKRTILEAMTDFTLIKIPWQYALTALPIMRGRQFSIASGGAQKVDDCGRTRVQLLIAIVEPPSPIIKYRKRYGVCTRYIATLQQKQSISVCIQPGYLDVHPTELDVPAVMIGPGTGLAPMRSMIHERALWAENAHRPTSTSLQGDILFFGCRAEHSDYFFHDEWKSFAHANSLTVHTAFSRDPKHHPKAYVQDQIRAHGAHVYEALVQRNGKVYVCGSSGNMPKGVRQALVEVLATYSGGGGSSLSTAEAEEEAERYLQGMEKSGRYKQETW